MAALFISLRDDQSRLISPIFSSVFGGTKGYCNDLPERMNRFEIFLVSSRLSGVVIECRLGNVCVWELARMTVHLFLGVLLQCIKV